ncbi:hypothetical protein HY285_04385 [Candidatus Peregrinibacteria bacterium]|nr:hypothetical protein [Candidatus Peregrinibacteria bacterium]MBI3816751.1 hypothetical protein [Candidatus Peregrinibacteria bacterium]
MDISYHFLLRCLGKLSGQINRARTIDLLREDLEIITRSNTMELLDKDHPLFSRIGFMTYVAQSGGNQFMTQHVKGFSLSASDRAIAQWLLEQQCYETILKEQFPELLRLPEGAVNQCQEELRRRIARLLDQWEMSSLNERTPNAEISVRSQCFDLSVEAWGRCRPEPETLVDAITAEAGISDDILASPRADVLAATIMPFENSPSEVFRRMIILEQLSLYALMQGDQEGVKELSSLASSLIEKHRICDCDIPGVGLLGVAYGAKYKPLNEVRQQLSLCREDVSPPAASDPSLSAIG